MEQQCILIQKIWRGYITRKNLITIKDGMTLNKLDNCLNTYIYTINFDKEINKNLTKKKIRYSNFPSHISENIVKYVIRKKYKIMPTWDTDKGDLLLINLRLEVKGSLNLFNGPPTFGPTEYWDRIYFLDGKDIMFKKFQVYEIKLSNTSEKWKNLRVNKKETFFDHCQQKRRPRLNFKEIQNQLGKDCVLIFNGFLSDLF
jgi:hypothetical protein